MEERTGYPNRLLASNSIRNAQCKEFYVRHVRDSVLALVLAGALVGFVACEYKSSRQPEPPWLVKESSPAEQPILPVDQPADLNEPEPPVLREESAPVAEPDSLPGPVADNSRCHVCHINFQDEALTFVHAQANVGCERCHGASNAHCSDEDNITPPDVMFPKAKIMSFCMSCHTRDKIDIAVHESVMAQTDPLKACCTDCHGEHRLNYRTRKWDKVTRGLIKDDRVRMLTDETPERE